MTVGLTFPAQLVADPPPAADCIGCHSEGGTYESHTDLHIDPAAVAASAHGALTCADCHVGFAQLPHPPFYVTGICASCHAEVAAVYGQSVHGQAVAAGKLEAAGCTSCHGEHSIVGPDDPASSVAPHVLPHTCASCHDEERIASPNGLPSRRLATYLDSYHGVANQHGGDQTANCTSCHGVHDILPAADPRSSIHPDNVNETCGACHPGVREGWRGGRIHVEPSPESSPGMYYVRVFYTYFIGGLMACFVAYMGVEMYGSFHGRRRR